MPEERTLDLNNGEDTPSGDGQPQNNSTDSTTDDAVDIDKFLNPSDEGGEEDNLDDEEGKEEVTLTKKEVAELKKQAKDGENYKKGLLAVKDKQKKQKDKGKQTPQVPATQQSDSNVVTKDELQKRDQQAAIKEASKDQVIDKNWDGVMQYYRPPLAGTESQETYQEAIEDAKHKFLRLNPDKAPSDNTDDNATRELGSDNAKPGGTAKPSGKQKPKKTIIPPRVSPKDWY